MDNEAETTDVEALAATIDKLKGCLLKLKFFFENNNFFFYLFRCYKKYKYCHATTLC